ncbi:hypothetical protein BGW80DRAFT_1309569 [Lactifluus volemus]|nr:hypothetical protein BGW80DRAFT_1309569 [Lactifluus volemus]
MPRLSDRNNCGQTCQAISSDSACSGATPGPAESEDRRIADGSSASSAVRVDA